MLELYKNIKKFRLEKGMTQDELAKLTGYTDRSSIAKVERGDVDLPQSKIMLFASALNIDAGTLMGDVGVLSPSIPEGTMRIVKRTLPVLGRIACGEPVAEAEVSFDDVEEAPVDADFALYAKGDSMINARINDGDLVFIKKMNTVENGDIAVVLIDDEATLKRFYYYEDTQTVQLVAENPAYRPLVYTGTDAIAVKVLGKAVAFRSEIE